MTVQLDNKQQAVDFRDYIADKLDELLDTAADDVFTDLVDLRTAVVIHVNQVLINLPALLTYQPPEVLPAVVVAHNLYADAGREDDVVTRNNPAHPGFVAGAVEYLK